MAKKKEKKGFTPELHELFDTFMRNFVNMDSVAHLLLFVTTKTKSPNVLELLMR